MELKDAFDRLKDEVQRDPHYAWGWQCNLAMPMQDAGVGHRVANLAAARIMSILFDVDVTQFQYFREWGYK